VSNVLKARKRERMKFILNVRKVEERDLNSRTPFLPDGEEYEMYLNAFHNELSGISIFSKVVRSGSSFEIETAQPTDEEKLRELLKPILQATVENLRFVSLVAS